MNGDTLKKLTTDLLAGREIGSTLFFQLVNLAKDKRERMRPWVILREEDSSLTVSGSNVYTTPQSLPTDFLTTYGKTPVVLKSGDDVIELRTIAMSKIHQNKDCFGFYYIDYKNKKIGFTGAIDKSYTINLYCIKKSTKITSTTSWEFDDYDPIFGPLLAADVAVMQKGEIDYDDINARMVQFHGLNIETIINNMIQWDAALQVRELEV